MSGTPERQKAVGPDVHDTSVIGIIQLVDMTPDQVAERLGRELTREGLLELLESLREGFVVKEQRLPWQNAAVVIITGYLTAHYPEKRPVVLHLAVGREAVAFLADPKLLDEEAGPRLQREREALQTRQRRFSTPEEALFSLLELTEEPREDMAHFLGIGYNTLLDIASSLGERLRQADKPDLFEKIFPPTIKNVPK